MNLPRTISRSVLLTGMLTSAFFRAANKLKAVPLSQAKLFIVSGTCENVETAKLVFF